MSMTRLAVPEPRAHGGVAGTARLRVAPEDFEVEEIARFEPDGHGGHRWLWVEKRGQNTDWVARQLARAAGVAPRDIGFAGLKDRHAVTRQWFSMPLPETDGLPRDVSDLEGVRVLEAVPHGRKLKRGTLAGNRFRLVLRGFQGDRERLEARLRAIRDDGVPNYFGPQRFGRHGANLPRALRWLERGGRVSRNERGRHFSVLRSAAFNDVLAARVRRGDWNRLLDGEQAMLDGSRSLVHGAPPSAELRARCDAFDLHPTAAMIGAGGAQPTRVAGQVESAALLAWRGTIARLADREVAADRRPTRVRPGELEWGLEGDALELRFSLPAGAYATTVLREALDANDNAGEAR